MAELRIEVDSDRRESLYAIDGAHRALIARDLETGAVDVDGRRVDRGWGADLWDLGDAWLVRVASGWRAVEGEGGGEIRERYLISRDGGASWSELDGSDARALEHRRTDDRRIARIDRWPGGFC